MKLRGHGRCRCRPLTYGRAWAAIPLAGVALAVAPASAAGSETPVTVHIGAARAAAESLSAPLRGDRAIPVADAARAHIARLAPRLGLDEPRRELRLSGVVAPLAAGSVVRFQQLHGGVPVFAGELVARLDGDGRLLSLAGELLGRGVVGTEPRVPAAGAEAIARAHVAGAVGVEEESLSAAAPRLRIYDPRLLGAAGAGARLVWLVDVDAASGEMVDELVLVDAREGSVAVSLPDRPAAGPDRRICNARHTNLEVCEPPYSRGEGDPPTGIADVDEAYENLGYAYEFYLDRFRRDSYDGRGAPLEAIVRYCPVPQLCPDDNAGWDDGRISFGDDYAVLDITGHELTHGVTEQTSGLIYALQSGAINESMSDVFGVLIQNYAEPGSNPDWLIGENLPTGALRDMSDPPRFKDPDRMRSRLYDGVENEVHTNSGVGNKAAYLITEGGSFRSRAVNGLGVEKAGAIYYEALVGLLTSGSGYLDLAFALQQGCRNLVGGPEGIVPGDCAEIRKAVDATGMRRQPRGARIRRPRACSDIGTRPAPVFFDDLENPRRGIWKTVASGRVKGWRYPPTRRGRNATSGRLNFWGPLHPGERGRGMRGRQAAIQMRGPVRIPRRGWLHFRHQFTAQDPLGAEVHDGAVLEYRVGGNRRWHDAGDLFDAGGYTGRITPGLGNPLARRKGRRAFVRSTNGYGASRVRLAPLSGRRVRFRFRTGASSDLQQLADWFIDDIQIYRCVSR